MSSATFFQLRDGVSLGILHVGGLLDPTGADVTHLLGQGRPVELTSPLRAHVSTVGRLQRYFHTSFDVPLAVSSLRQAIRERAPDDVQLVDVVGLGEKYSALNVTRVVECVDEHTSKYSTLDAEVRPDRVGWFKHFERLCIRAESVPPDAEIFLVARWLGIVVRDRFRALMLAEGCDGAVFDPVAVS